MSPPPASLKDICGGRFAFMAAADCEDAGVSPGAVLLYFAMCGRADKADRCKFCLKAYAQKIGKSRRTVQIWKRQLECQGWIEELHEGDKAIGQFQVIRNPKERALVRIKNAPKIADRAKRKTTHANLASHPRCESGFAQYKNIQDPPVSPREQSAAPSEPDDDTGVARQGNQKAAQMRAQIVPAESVRTLNNRNHEPDWNGWEQWLVLSGQLPVDKAWLWLMAQIDRIKEERNVSSEEAGRLLDEWLKIQRRLQK